MSAFQSTSTDADVNVTNNDTNITNSANANGMTDDVDLTTTGTFSDEATEESLVEEFSTKANVSTPSQLITKLVPLFLTKCVNEFNTNLKKYFTATKPSIYDKFTQKKQYNKFHRTAHTEKNDGTDYVVPTDRDRYNALMKAIVEDIQKTGSCEKYLQYPDVYFNKMYDIFCSDETFSVMEGEFKKGAKGILLQLGKVFNIEKSDTLDGIDELMIMVKQFQIDSDKTAGFDTILKASANDIYMYARTDESKDPSNETDEERMEFINSLAFPIFDNGINTLCFYEDKTNEKFTSFWLTDNKLGDEFHKVTCDEILSALTRSSFSTGNLYYTNLVSIKRNYMKKNFDMIRHNAYMLKTASATYKERNDVFTIDSDNPTDLHFYHGTYKMCDGMNEIPEGNISNAIMGFPQSFGELSDYAFASFLFNGEVGNIKIDSYWIFSQSREALMATIKKEKTVEKEDGDDNDKDDDNDNATQMKARYILSEDDNNAFDWTELSIDEFIERVQQRGTMGTSCLH